eukprot:TRINITY_DN12965_c0_g1_i1.p1 TRINITY_DN12965_c0_g1~~TRINITY_DN12965_c0_g1_i1.p1  ORF type:complete len:157 (-),score=26.12 TRINITY_DN12965_c0_g1_i1:34-504(-)
MTQQRLVFISASYLCNDYRRVPASILADALFFFGSNRSWVFPGSDLERRESKQQPTRYLEFDEAFRQLILSKEEKGEVYWLKPDRNYHKVSAWLQTLRDPHTGQAYAPLRLVDKDWVSKGRQDVVRNYNDGEHDYRCVMALVADSNASLKPVLRYE